MKKKIIIFDLDDTLIDNVKFYIAVKDKLFNKFTKFFGKGIDKEAFLTFFKKIDLIKAKRLKLSRNRFPASAVELYFSYCLKFNKKPISSEVEEIFICANSVFDYAVQINEKTRDVLRKLSRNNKYQLMILTAGDRLVQTYKIKQSKLFRFYFKEQNILIVPEKNELIYKSRFEKYGFENCVMIGNSARSDIKPAIECGMNAIFIPKETWEYETADLKNHDKLKITDDIINVPDLLKEIFG